ncbi:hypothetical protein P9112_008317 [Eukaryota sp. TZLM1-RC]
MTCHCNSCCLAKKRSFNLPENVILASTSKGRFNVLKSIFPYLKAIPSHFDESSINFTDPYLLVSSLSQLKALSVLDANPHLSDIFIGTDSMTVFQDQVLGKPKTPEEAHSMLSLLQGNTHSLITGVTLLQKQKSEIKMKTYTETTLVTFNDVSSQWISDYIKLGECYYSCGGYFIDSEVGSQLKKSLNGCIYNVIGVGLGKLQLELDKFTSE